MVVAGLQVVPAANLAANGGPIGAPHEDWFMYEPWLTTSGAGGLIDTDGGLVIDVKSNRKLEELGQQLLLSVQCPAGITFDVAMQLSILLMLP